MTNAQNTNIPLQITIPSDDQQSNGTPGAPLASSTPEVTPITQEPSGVATNPSIERLRDDDSRGM